MSSINIGDATLHYVEQGSGPNLLLIPGLGLDHGYYRLGIEHLHRSFTTIAIDPRGIGESTISPSPYSVEAWADDFARFIDRLGRGPLHVLGSSLGGAMALALARYHPEHVKSLTVVGAFSELDRAAQMNFRLRAKLIERLGFGDEVADYMGLWTMSREFINSAAGFEQMKLNQQIIRRNRSDLYLEFVRSVLRWARCEADQIGEPLFTEQLSHIKKPTLVVTADNDNLIPMQCSLTIAERVPNAELCVLPGAGHIPFIEQPEKVCEVVTTFVSACEERSMAEKSDSEVEI